MHLLPPALAFPILLSVAPPAHAQTARVTVLVSRTDAGRDVSSANADIRAQTESLFARCEPLARAARPLHTIFLSLSVDTTGRVTAIHSGGVPAEYLAPDGMMRRPTAAQTERVRRWIACASTAARRLRFSIGASGALDLQLAWQEAGPATGVMGPL